MPFSCSSSDMDAVFTNVPLTYRPHNSASWEYSSGMFPEMGGRDTRVREKREERYDARGRREAGRDEI